MGQSPNYGRNSNIFHITNALNSLQRKWYTGNQYMVKFNRNYSAILATLQITSYALGV
jgi:hypothetical protein